MGILSPKNSEDFVRRVEAEWEREFGKEAMSDIHGMRQELVWVTWNGGQAVVHGSKLTRLIIDHATDDVRWGFVDRSKSIAQSFVGLELTN